LEQQETSFESSGRTATSPAFAPKMHVSLNVRDVVCSVAFYEAFFGIPPHKRRPGYANFDIASPPLKLALQENAPVEARLSRLSHIGVQVASAEAVDFYRERLIAAGSATFDEGATVCCYARQDEIWATDPGGNGWEIYFLIDELDDHEDDEFDSGVTTAPIRGAVCCGEDAPACAVLTIRTVIRRLN